MAEALNKEVLVRNTSYNFISQIYFALLAFFTTPYMVRMLGVDSYGILSIVGIVCGYFSFLDLGLGQGIIKYVSGDYAKKDYAAIRKTITTALFAQMLMGVVGAFIIAASAQMLITKTFHIPQEKRATAQFVFYLSAISFLFNMAQQVFRAIPQALHRFDITNKIQLFLGTGVIAAQLLFLYLGYSLRGLVILNAVVSAILLLVYFYFSVRLLPEVSFFPSFNVSAFKTLFRFGGFSSLGRIMSTIAVNVDKLLISMFLPISYLTYYTVPYNLTMQIMAVAPGITSVIFPAISSMDSLKDYERLKELYLRVSRYIVTGVGIFAILLIVFGDTLLYYWLGAVFAQKAGMVIKILALGIMVNCLSWVPGVTASSLDKPELPAAINTLQALTGFLLCLIFIPRFGIIGAALAWTLRDALLVPYFVYKINKKLVALDTMEFIRKSLLKPCMAVGILFFLSRIAKNFMVNLVTYSIGIGVLLLLYGVLVYIFVLDEKERALIRIYVKPGLLERLTFRRRENQKSASANSYAHYNVKIMTPSLARCNESIAISFYTLAYNRLEYTKRMIESLLASTTEGFQHVIINQSSSDGTREYLDGLKSRYPHIDWEIVHLEKNVGLISGQNMAIERCYGNLLIKMDNDCRILSKDIDKHLKALYNLIGFDYVISPFPVGLITNLGGAKRYGFEVYYSEETDRYYTLGLTHHLGGMFRCIPKKILTQVEAWQGYSFEKMGNRREDDFISKKIASSGFKLAYLENDCVVEHQESTLGQHERYCNEYFQGRF